MIDAIQGFIDQFGETAALGYMIAPAVLIAAGVYITLRRTFFGLRAHNLSALNRRAARDGAR